MAKVMTMMRSVSMPMSRAVSGSCEVARMARPVVAVTKKAASRCMMTSDDHGRSQPAAMRHAADLDAGPVDDLRERDGLLASGARDR